MMIRYVGGTLDGLVQDVESVSPDAAYKPTDQFDVCGSQLYVANGHTGSLISDEEIAVAAAWLARQLAWHDCPPRATEILSSALRQRRDRAGGPHAKVTLRLIAPDGRAVEVTLRPGMVCGLVDDVAVFGWPGDFMAADQEDPLSHRPAGSRSSRGGGSD